MASAAARRIRRRAGVLLGLAAVAAMGGLGCQQQARYATWTLQPKALLANVEHFRACVHADPVQAIPDRMTPEVAAVFQEAVDAAYGPSYQDGRVPPEMARRVWRFFFDTSIYMIHYPGPKSALVLFYNPYTDAAALLRWDETAEGLCIGDAELMGGDWLRGKRRPPYPPIAGWRTREGLAAAAVAETTYETMEGFGRTFAGLRPPTPEKVQAMDKAEVEAMLARQADWRAHAPGLDRETTRSGHRLVAGMRLRLNLLALDLLANATDRAALRDAAARVIQTLAAGRADAVLARAADTPPRVAGYIRERDRKSWEGHGVVAYGLAPDGTSAFVFTADWREQNAFVCISFTPDKAAGTWTPARIDYVSCRGYARIRSEQAGGTARASAR